MSRSTFFTRFALVGSIALTLGASAFSACKTEETTTGDSSDSSSSAGGAGGAGGSQTVASSSAAGGGDAGPNHYICVGVYTTAKMGTCDFLNQDCPPGQQCSAVKNMATGKFVTQCVTSTMGFKVAGEDCEFADECESGLFCVLNRCSPVCCPSSNEPCGSGLCIVQSNLGNSASDYVQTCFYGDQCQLFDPGSCPQKMGKIKEYCHVINQKMGVVACIANGGNGTPVPLGQPCQFLNDCGSNQGCNGGMCEWYCDPTMLAQPAGLGGCNPGDTCVGGTGAAHYCVPKMVPKDAGGG